MCCIEQHWNVSQIAKSLAKSAEMRKTESLKRSREADEDQAAKQKTAMHVSRLNAAKAHVAGCTATSGLLQDLARDGPVMEPQAASTSPPATLHKPVKCYVCKSLFTALHHFYDQLCPPCAALNYTKRFQTADLSGAVAVVTGARMKIGE